MLHAVCFTEKIQIISVASKIIFIFHAASGLMVAAMLATRFTAGVSKP